jgi:hypothetical protein
MPHEHDLGLAHDLPRLVSRRHALLLGAGALLAGCGGGSSGEQAATTATASDASAIPEETAGPTRATAPTARTS